MAKQKQALNISPNTVIEVIRIRGDEVIKKDMTLSEWLSLKKQQNCIYIPYQKGYSQFETTK